MKRCIFLSMILFIVACSKKQPEPIIASAGKTTIPLSEFRDRFELTPQVNHSTDVERNKRNLLVSLIGEKLLVHVARQQGLDQSDKFLAYAEQMEKEALVEKLLDAEIGSKISIKPEEVKEGFFRSQVTLDLKVLTFDSLKQAIQAKKEIDAGKSMDQVKREFRTDSFISADSVLSIHLKWGEAHPKLEDAAYSLQWNEVSTPIFVEGRYYLLKLANRTSAVFVTEADFINQAPAIRKKITQRKRTELYAQYLNSLMSDKQVRVSHQVFNQVASELEKMYGIKENYTISENAPSEFSFDSLKTEDFAEHLNDTFARFSDGSTWTVGDFIKMLSLGPYKLNKESQQSFRNSLHLVVRRMAEFESLAKKGYQAGLEKSYYVYYQKKMWEDSYLGQMIRQQLIDTVAVSEAEIEFYYEKHQENYVGPDLIKLQEILVDEKELAQQIFDRLKKGEDMGALARRYNKREISLKTDGRMGYFTPGALGKIGQVAWQIAIGEIAGPVKTEKNQYSVFKVLDKRAAGVLPFEQVQDDVKGDALAEKRIRTIDNYLIELAEKFPVKVNESVIDTLKMNDFNMLVLKLHFAGRTAAPIVTPLQQAFRWQNKMDKIYPLKR